MAKTPNNTPSNDNVDMETLKQNLIALETENRMLKDQKNELQQKYDQLSAIPPVDSEKLKFLEETNNALEQTINQLQEDKKCLEEKLQQASSQIPETTELQSKLDASIASEAQAVTDRDKWRKKAEELQDKYKTLKEQMDNRQEPETGIILSPFVKAYLDRLTTKLSARYNKQVEPKQIIEDYIIRYNLSDKWTQWFHPFVMTEKDAVEIANKINPEITTFEHVLQAIGLQK